VRTHAMPYELIAILMFSTMMLMLLTGQRVFGAIGFVAVMAALFLWGDRGGYDIGFSAAIKLMRWYPLLTLPMFIFMGYVLSESKIADDLYKMFHVFMGGVRGGLAIGTIGLMVLISAMNGLSVAGMAIGATIALPELLKRNYDKLMVTGVIQAGSSLGILVPPSVVLVLYAMIARQPVGQLWLAGAIPGLMMATMFIIYIAIRCRINPELGPALSPEERDVGWPEKLRLLRAGLLPVVIFAVMMVPFVNGWTSLVESSAIGAIAAFLAAILKGRMTRQVFETSVRQTLAITCMFMWIILAALAFGAVFDGLGAVKAIENLFTEQWGLNPWVILILMQLSFLVMGTFLDDTAMLVIVAPLYVPLVGALGFDLVWYGVLYTITCQIAYMTPPFGYNLFLMRAMAPPEITITDIYRSIIPFVGVMILALAVVMLFPQIALWLPNYVYGK
jgi:tripartite ATP-independent transporter DctM subunit